MVMTPLFTPLTTSKPGYLSNPIVMHRSDMYEETVFSRDCPVIIVPDGTPTTIPEGAEGFITQVLGGNFTVQMTNGYMVRVAGKDADAIGREVAGPPTFETDGEGDVILTEELLWNQLKGCFDPEIPVNIVDLGLVYECELLDGDEGEVKAKVTMTLTAPGCGMGQVLVDDVEAAVSAIPGIVRTDVDLVFDPPWTPDRMNEAARLELGFM